MNAARQAFQKMDDVLGQLGAALEVIEVITEGHVSNNATIPLHQNYKRLREIVYGAWDEVVKPLNFEDDLFHEGDTVFLQGKAYTLGRYYPSLKGWDLLHGGTLELTLRADLLRKSIDGIKFREARA